MLVQFFSDTPSPYSYSPRPAVLQPFYMMTDFLAFDDAVKVAVDFAKDDGDTLVLVFPDHNTGGLKIGNYGHGYTDTTLEAVRDPFLSMDMTANGVVSSVPKVNATNEDMINAVKAHWKLDITNQDVDDIYSYKNTSGKSLSYSMARLLSERYTYIGWTSHGHNGETGMLLSMLLSFRGVLLTTKDTSWMLTRVAYLIIFSSPLDVRWGCSTANH